ncbi:alpha-(1,3)-fucosyltransferase 9-like [Myripristis murdjan]|uniref:alpha-(1,3)-fucosyltransferase 9-like n=1 Tax=Myripristis murdjan TaxID=586833 RepID=UPI001175EA37|nr:alpha-(1,3)-fucosyltransferase 9-like [Myripristis murdjan]
MLRGASLHYHTGYRLCGNDWTVDALREAEVMVLIWHWPFEKPFDLNSCESRFNISGCHFTVNRELFSKADALLIHHREIHWNLSNLPQGPRPVFQKWIWMNFESPSNSQRIPLLNDQFNLTMNYRQDADISQPYGAIIKTSKEVEPFVPRKNKLVCWIISNWRLEQKRVRYFKNLHRYIHIHIYGAAFYSRVSERDYRMLLASCKFYLAFENSIHLDYITEKVYRPLRLGSVPVVLGPPRENYEKFIPGDAFIHVDDFSSPQALAKHLCRLDKNEAMYRKYFNWKWNHRVSLNSFPIQNVCYSCNYIKQHHSRKQTFTNLYKWYWGSKSVKLWEDTSM